MVVRGQYCVVPAGGVSGARINACQRGGLWSLLDVIGAGGLGKRELGDGLSLASGTVQYHYQNVGLG